MTLFAAIPTYAVLFASTSGLVFALGLQSLNVNGGHRVLAVGTSFMIGSANLVVLKVVPGPTSALDVLAYLFGGPFGIWLSMLAHPWLVAKLGRKPSAPAPAHDAGATRMTLALQHARLVELAQDICSPEGYGHVMPREVITRTRSILDLVKPAPSAVHSTSEPFIPQPATLHRTK